MGLRDWVSEMDTGGIMDDAEPHLASMGLRDWVSEMARGSGKGQRGAARFNGAPRLGLGDGWR